MRITELLDAKSIRLNGTPGSKKEAIDQMVELMCASGKINDKEEYRRVVYAREEESTTGVGEGIAIPHGKSNAVSKPGLAAMIVPNGVDFDSLDGAPVDVIFLIAAPNTKDNVHLDVLSKLSVLLMDEEFTKRLKNAKTVEEFLNVIDDTERAKDKQDEGETNLTENSIEEDADSVSEMILAVTGCPTGIAHTYMAAEALEKAAAKKGIPIKVETRGSGGAKNILTQGEIDKACCIIVAADTKVPMERFAGKKVIICQVSDGISKADQLIEKALHGKIEIYQGDGSSKDTGESTGKESIGHQLYKHLMNGVSHMLPFVVGGGILIAIAFLLDDYSIDPSNFGTNTPVAAWFKNIGGFAFSFMLPVLAGYIAMSIADRPGLAVGFVGGYLASIGSTFANPGGDIPSGFLGALLAGFVAGYLVLGLKKLSSILPDSMEGIKPVLIYPLVGILAIAVFMCAIDPAIAWLNSGLTNMLESMGDSSKILLGCVLGGMMSIDMGGPFNKAAYTFGAGILANQTDSAFMIMAAVMIGGMVPPMAVALATTIFRKKFTSEEKKAGPVNYVMGLCFITEGAIPFAAADPLRVIPSCIVGSAIAGGLSMAFECTLRAPHGGVFVFPTVGNVGFYILALVVGSVVSAVMIGLLKKDVQSKQTK